MFAIAIELRVECPRCASPVFVPALVSRATCTSCQTVVDLRVALAFATENSFWEEIVRYGQHDLSTQDGRLRGTGQVTAPVCGSCSAALQLPVGAGLEQTTLVCGSCDAPALIRVPPRRDVRAPHFVSHLLGEDPDAVPAEQKGEALQSRPAAAPVRFPCPSCDASLEVDGTARTVECTYCHQSAYLPDDLWRRLHPVSTKRRWYLLVDDGRFKTYARSSRGGRTFGLAYGGCALGAFALGLPVGIAWQAPWWLAWSPAMALGAAGVACIVHSFRLDSRAATELTRTH